MSRTEAVEALYQDMAARHRARFGSIHVRSITTASFPEALNNRTFLTNPRRSSRLLRSRTPTPSAAPTSSSSSPRTSSSPCPTAPSSLARSCTLTLAPLPSRKCEDLGVGKWSVGMNDYVMAIACTKDTDHAENKACIYNPENGTDGFYVSLVVLCSDPFKLFHKNTGVISFLFTQPTFLVLWVRRSSSLAGLR